MLGAHLKLHSRSDTLFEVYLKFKLSGDQLLLTGVGQYAYSATTSVEKDG